MYQVKFASCVPFAHLYHEKISFKNRIFLVTSNEISSLSWKENTGSRVEVRTGNGAENARRKLLDVVVL
jgi:hypothetical protein